MRVGLISLEPWDQVWRRNQHFATQIIRAAAAEHITFVEPPVLGATTGSRKRVDARILVVRPPLIVPKRFGGLSLTGVYLKASVLREIDILWINDPSLGVHCLSRNRPALYDVTDDWREFDFNPRIRRRLIRAEDCLSKRARTVVCSDVLRERWAERYDVQAAVVHNGVDEGAWKEARPRRLLGGAPHVGYIGTLHEERIDIDLILSVASRPEVGQLHLVGPNALSEEARQRLAVHQKVRLHGPVPSGEVPGFAKAMDVLISPHLVSDFTMSLDAIKSYEYLASGRPVVATPTSGFQLMSARALSVVMRETFPDAVVSALGGGSIVRPEQNDWSQQASQFAHELRAAMLVPSG